MREPRDRYDTGHRPAVGEFTGMFRAEIDGIASPALDAVRQSPGIKCHTWACSLLCRDAMWKSAGSCANHLIRSLNRSAGGWPGTPTSRHVPGHQVVAFNQDYSRHFGITRRGPATLFGDLRPRLAKATGRDIRPALRDRREEEVAGD